MEAKNIAKFFDKNQTIGDEQFVALDDNSRSTNSQPSDPRVSMPERFMLTLQPGGLRPWKLGYHKTAFEDVLIIVAFYSPWSLSTRRPEVHVADCSGYCSDYRSRLTCMG
jgi:hypothetical protein